MVKLVGREKIDYVSKKTGKRVLGYSLYFVDLEDDSNVEGMKVSSHFVKMDSYERFFSVPLDTKMELHYDYYRNVNGCTCVFE